MDLIIIVAQQPTSPTPMSSSVRHFNPTSYHGASFASVLLEKDSREIFQRQICLWLSPPKPQLRPDEGPFWAFYDVA
jgi:hypothetical protein